MIHRIRVIFGDTDQMGIVYYANYYRYFEAARAAFLRAMGRSQADLVSWDVALPVVESGCQYKRPARYEDVLEVHVDIDETKAASLRFAYEVKRKGELIAKGHTWHACVDHAGRPHRMPPPFLELIAQSRSYPPEHIAE